MKNFFISLSLFLLPTVFCRIVFLLFKIKTVQIGKKCHIGFSWLNCSKLILKDGSCIGHFNYIHNKELLLGGGKIKHLNMIKGNFSLIMENGAWINSQNKIASNWASSDHPKIMYMKSDAAIIMKHTFDLTDSITIGEGTLFAGVGSQVWTHAFYLGSKQNACVVGSVTLGKKCYIGSGSIICANVNICDYVALGAGVTVAKDINIAGLYVNQPIRYIEYTAEKAIENLGEPIFANSNIYRKNIREN